MAYTQQPQSDDEYVDIVMLAEDGIDPVIGWFILEWRARTLYGKLKQIIYVVFLFIPLCIQLLYNFAQDNWPRTYKKDVK